MTDILILTASFGMGHKSVSKAIKENIESENLTVKVDIDDIWEIVNPKIKDFGSKMYYSLTENYPVVYNTLYDIKKENKNNIIDSILCQTHYKKLYNHIVMKNPKVIVSTFPLCSCFVSKIKREFGLKTNLITVITDVVDSWEWIYPGTNMYLVPSYEIRNSLIRKGIDKNIVIAAGIPVKKDFMYTKNCDNTIKNTLLIVATGMSEDDINNKILTSLNNKGGLKTIVVTGRNEKLYNKLLCDNLSNVQIFGFVNNIHCLMDESVFIVTKPGGVTLFEAINKELPLIIKDSGIGQEKGNIDFVRQNNLGIVIKDSNDLLNIVDDYIRSPQKARYLCRNMRTVKNNLKSNALANYVLNKVI